MPIRIMGLKQFNIDIFGFLDSGQKINNYQKTIVSPFNIQRLKVHVANKHSTKTSCTMYVFKVFYTNAKKRISIKFVL
jgi:hypothetical protein